MYVENINITDREAVASRKMTMFGNPVTTPEVATETDLYFYPGQRYYFNPTPLFRGRWITGIESTPDPVNAGGAAGLGYAYINNVGFITLKNYAGETLLYRLPWYEITWWFEQYPFISPPQWQEMSGDFHYTRKFNLYDVCMEQSYFEVSETVLQLTFGLPDDQPAYSWNLIFSYTDTKPYLA